MIFWENLERIISGDLMPHTVKEGSIEFNELFTTVEKYDLNKPEFELIDIEYPAPYSIKTDLYYKLINYELEKITNGFHKLTITFPDKQTLEFQLNNQLRYALKLLEKADIYRKRYNNQYGNNYESIFLNENHYIAGCIYKYFNLIINDIIFFFNHLNLDEMAKNHYFYQKEKIAETSKKFDLLLENKKINLTELFNLLIPNEIQDEFIMRFYSYLKNSHKIDINLTTFRRHFISSTEQFEKIIWRKSVPLLKHTFQFLINKNIIEEPSTTLDSLLNQHFIKKDGKEIGINYLSQGLSREPYDSPNIQNLHSELQSILSNISSNKI